MEEGRESVSSGDFTIPSLGDIDNVNTIRPCLPQVRLHVCLEVLAADVALRGEKHFDVVRGGVKHRREVGGSHLRGC